MKKYTANADQAAWLTAQFGAVRRFSYTDGHETAWFADDLKISNGEHERFVRGYGHEGYDAVGDLFGYAAQIKAGEYYMQNGRRIDPDPQIFTTNVLEFKAA